MKARIRATGDVYNVIDMNDYRNRFQLEDNNWYTMGEIELIEGYQPDWQQVRIQAAIAAMQGFIGVPQMPFGHIAEEAVKVADALVAELQKKGGNQ